MIELCLICYSLMLLSAFALYTYTYPPIIMSAVPLQPHPFWHLNALNSEKINQIERVYRLRAL